MLSTIHSYLPLLSDGAYFYYSTVSGTRDEGLLSFQESEVERSDTIPLPLRHPSNPASSKLAWGILTWPSGAAKAVKITVLRQAAAPKHDCLRLMKLILSCQGNNSVKASLEVISPLTLISLAPSCRCLPCCRCRDFLKMKVRELIEQGRN